MRRLLAAFLLSLVALPANASLAIYTCAIDGVSRVACCCRERASDAGCACARGACCDVHRIEGASDRASVSRRVEPPTAAAARPATVGGSIWPEPGSARLLESVRATPPAPPPRSLLARKTSYLL